MWLPTRLLLRLTPLLMLSKAQQMLFLIRLRPQLRRLEKLLKEQQMPLLIQPLTQLKRQLIRPLPQLTLLLAPI